jgi:hypothetical protein
MAILPNRATIGHPRTCGQEYYLQFLQKRLFDFCPKIPLLGLKPVFHQAIPNRASCHH